MLITAEQKNSRQSARKVRLVADAIRGLTLTKAVEQLGVMEKKSTIVVMKVLKQAIANAVNNLRLDVADLELKEIIVGDGPTYKRFRAVSRGRGHGVLKHSCHVRIVLETKGDVKAQPVKAETVEAVEAEEVVATSTESEKIAESKSTKKIVSAKVANNRVSKGGIKAPTQRRVQAKGK